MTHVKSALIVWACQSPYLMIKLNTITY